MTADSYAYLAGSEVATSAGSGGSTGTSLLDAVGTRLAVKTGSAVAWLVFDLHGSVAGLCPAGSSSLTDAYRYSGWGEQVASAGSAVNPWRYRGLLNIGSDALAGALLDMASRDYSPQLGVFTSQDSYAGSAADPASLNRFLYALANPATLVDPDGHMALVADGGYIVPSYVPDSTESVSSGSTTYVSTSKTYVEAPDDDLYCHEATCGGRAQSARSATKRRQLPPPGTKGAAFDTVDFLGRDWCDRNAIGYVPCYAPGELPSAGELRRQLGEDLTYVLLGVVSGVATVAICSVGSLACVVAAVSTTWLGLEVPDRHQDEFFAGSFVGGLGGLAARPLFAGAARSGPQAFHGIVTPRGLAIQGTDPASLTLRAYVLNGGTVYRQGSFFANAAGEGQHWAGVNPLLEGNFASAYGLPLEGVDFVIGGTIKADAPFVTRLAPGVGGNLGGAPEVVVNPGSVGNLWMVMPGG